MNILKPVVSLLLACAAAVLPGCAGAPPSPAEMQHATAAFRLPALPQPGQALVYVVRPYSLHTLARFNVFVDSQEDAAEVGYTRGNQYLYFSLAPGTHRIYSRGENWAEVDLAVNAGDIVFLKQEPSMGLIGSRNTLTRIGEDEGRYYVMKEKPGTLKAPVALPGAAEQPGK